MRIAYTIFFELRERFSQWTATAEKTPEDDDKCSVASRISLSSSVSTISELRKAKAQFLVLEHKLKEIQEMHELELAADIQIKELELKQQLFDTQCELGEAVLEKSVWREADDEDRAVIYVSSPAPRSATEYLRPDGHADGGRTGVSSTGRKDVSDFLRILRQLSTCGKLCLRRQRQGFNA
ncbi:hypothetical protein DPMN_045684 [Dreissena polymorpha]|uniref:Uncharacterized protein n=1 Tax=Dreissena polymorpha TaxID=45954 RepID=A0A9D4D6S6_DREPO|nr:hypothetical protein DPMN_045684 [Dreissena polymorpha]